MQKKILILTLLTFIYSCEELIEVEDISNELVNILAPTDNMTLENTTVNFSWQVMDFAETYHLQIAEPNFESTQSIVEDTLVSVTNFSKSLEVGNYQWRVKAINFGYETLYTTQNLTIED